jgi:hypothetical protein
LTTRRCDLGKELHLSSRHTHPLVRLGELTFQADDGTLVREVRALIEPAATLRLNGKESDITGYLRHVLELRSAMNDGAITVVDEIRDDRGPSAMLAARVLVRMNMKDGSVVLGESHLVGRLGNDDRITRMAEIGRLIVDRDDSAEVRW